jgi:hypothetical protein
MSAYNFRNIRLCWPEKITSGTWLWIWNPDKVPPHIGISVGQHYFSLTYREAEIQRNVAAMVRKAKRSGIPLVLADLSDVCLKSDLTAAFQQYERAGSDGVTCLTPVKEVIGVADNVKQLSELLMELEQRGNMKPVFAVHLTSAYQGIPHYTVSEIMQRIEQLHEAKRSESTIASR